MKRNKFFCVLLALAAVPLFFAGERPLVSKAAGAARGECVVEVSSRRILHGKDAYAQLPMASTTKVLTAILILDDCDLGDLVTVPKEAEGVEGSSVYLRAGETYTVKELLYGLMLRSGNDCAVTLAMYHSGDVKTFSDKMNEKAALLGAEGSFFVNPHGLPDSRHHTTARDLALISAYAMENETFREIVSCKYYEPRNWQNKNKMLFRYDGAVGVKTGFTTAAGRCLVTAAERNGMTFVCVVLNCPEMYERTAELLDGCLEDYSLYKLCDSTKPWENFGIKFDFSYPLKKTELKNLRFDTAALDPLPEKKGEVAGQMHIYLQNDLLFSQNLYII